MRRAATFGIRICGAVALLFCALAGLRVSHAGPEQVAWTETRWPFPMDQWGQGKAFRCKASDCGAAVVVYIRAKVGFCSSTRGVADDDELDRLADFDFMEGQAKALAGSYEIAVAGMKGRARAYAVTGVMRPHATAFSIAFNNNDDALVATAVFEAGSPKAVEPAILTFLRGPVIQRWLALTLGL